MRPVTFDAARGRGSPGLPAGSGECLRLGELVKAVLERALEAEMTAHLGYEKSVSSETVSRITGAALEEVKARQNRPLTIPNPAKRLSGPAPPKLPAAFDPRAAPDCRPVTFLAPDPGAPRRVGLSMPRCAPG